MSFLAQQFTTLSHIPVCLSRCQTKLGPGMTCCHWASFWGQTTHTHTHIQNTHTHWPQQRSLKRSDPTTVWVTVCLSLLQIEQLALSVWFCTLTQKDNSSVCAWGDYSIPVLLLSLSHANPGLPTLQSSETTQTHKKHKVATHREHGKLSNHFKRNG